MTSDTVASGALWRVDEPGRLDFAAVCDGLDVDPEVGLSGDEARLRQEVAGRNELPQPPTVALTTRLAQQLRDPMAILLLVAATVSGVVLGEVIDAVAILAIVVLNAAIAVVQEVRAASALRALRDLEVPLARVRRDGVVRQLDASELVPGDVALLEAGDRVPADLRLGTADGLYVDESILTGESIAVAKDPARLAAPDASLGERPGEAFSGTFVTAGATLGVVTTAGPNTVLGGIARQVAVAPRPTPLQTDLAHVTRQLGAVSIVVASGVLALTLVRTGVDAEGAQQAFLAAVALAVAAVPEGLATVTTVGLALGVRRMAERGAIVRRLSTVETLGSTTVLAVDKTGTLTENRMQVGGVVSTGGSLVPLAELEGERRALVERVMVLCNDATLDPAVGDPTEVALLEAVAPERVRHLRAAWTRVATAPFDSERMRMTTVHAATDEGGLGLHVKGAPEAVLPWCRTGPEGGPLDDDQIARDVHAAALRGARVLALARRTVTTVPDDPDAACRDLQLVGLVGLRDPVRQAAAASVDQAQAAGITLLMATGDHPGTGGAVAVEVGLSTQQPRVRTGAQLRRDGFDDDPATTLVYARVDPDQKLGLVERLQALGHVVGMTGDGVNDAPALRRADIGIALGSRSSDVAREAADMIITDDDLATIVTAVREGRGIYDNLRKVVEYLVAGNLSEILVVVGGLLFVPALGVPLLPLQLLWINLVTDGMPAIALGVDTPSADLMRRQPRSPDVKLLSWSVIRRLLVRGGVIAAATMATLAAARVLLGASWPEARTVMFTTLVIAQVLYAYVVRRGSGGVTSNGWLLLATAGGLAAQAVLVAWPPAQAVFDTTALPAAGWALAAIGGVLPNVVLWFAIPSNSEPQTPRQARRLAATERVRPDRS